MQLIKYVIIIVITNIGVIHLMPLKKSVGRLYLYIRVLLNPRNIRHLAFENIILKQ